MLIKTKIALVAALIAGTSSAAFAQGFDPNPANRGYPAYAQPDASAAPFNGLGGVQQRTYQSAPVAQQRGALQTAPVGLYQGGRTGTSGYSEQGDTGASFQDRAASPSAGGVN